MKKYFLFGFAMSLALLALPRAEVVGQTEDSLRNTVVKVRGEDMVDFVRFERLIVSNAVLGVMKELDSKLDVSNGFSPALGVSNGFLKALVDETGYFKLLKGVDWDLLTDGRFSADDWPLPGIKNWPFPLPPWAPYAIGGQTLSYSEATSGLESVPPAIKVDVDRLNIGSSSMYVRIGDFAIAIEFSNSQHATSAIGGVFKWVDLVSDVEGISRSDRKFAKAQVLLAVMNDFSKSINMQNFDFSQYWIEWSQIERDVILDESNDPTIEFEDARK